MSLACRLTTAGYVYLNTLSSSSVTQFGDARGSTKQKNRVIAVQRAIPDSYKDETRFASYPLFFKTLLNPGSEPPVRMNSASGGVPIRIGSVYVLGITASSVMRLGCSGPVQGESRIVNIRQFNDPARVPEELSNQRRGRPG
jgi:Protein of unknown function (DUF2772).